MNDIETEFINIFEIAPQYLYKSLIKGVWDKPQWISLDEVTKLSEKHEVEITEVSKLPVVITDSILINLIVILSGYRMAKDKSPYELTSTTKEDIKREILHDCLDYYEYYSAFRDCKELIQKLFIN